MNRRDFLGFSAGTALTSLLASVGDPRRVRLATATEVERIVRSTPVTHEGIGIEMRLYRFKSGDNRPHGKPLLHTISNVRGGVCWRAVVPEEELVLDLTGDTLRELAIVTDIRVRH